MKELSDAVAGLDRSIRRLRFRLIVLAALAAALFIAMIVAVVLS